MPTIGRKRPKRSPRGDVATYCDYCGIGYLRSELVRDGAGLLRCKDEGNGRDRVTLSQLTAQNSARPRRGVVFSDPGGFDHSDDPPATGNPTPYQPPRP